MNFGFNSNVQVESATYHVQSEDRGASHPFLDTVVYLAGRVVYRRSTGYEQLARGAEGEALAGRLHDLLTQQHRDVIAELEAGTLPLHIGEEDVSAGAGEDSPDSLDLQLVNPKSWFAGGEVTFEVELSEKNTKLRVSDADVEACLEQKNQRTSCAEAHTDAKGCATLRFSLPPNVSEDATCILRATDAARYAELRFRLKTKPRDQAPASTST